MKKLNIFFAALLSLLFVSCDLDGLEDYTIINKTDNSVSLMFVNLLDDKYTTYNSINSNTTVSIPLDIRFEEIGEIRQSPDDRGQIQIIPLRHKVYEIQYLQKYNCKILNRITDPIILREKHGALTDIRGSVVTVNGNETKDIEIYSLTPDLSAFYANGFPATAEYLMTFENNSPIIYITLK